MQGPRNTFFFYFYFSYFTSRDGASRGASCCEQMFLKHFQKYHIGLRGSIIVNLSNIGRCCEATKNTGKTYNENDDICFSLFIHIYCTVWLMRSKNTLLYFKKFAVTLLHKLWFLSLFVVFCGNFCICPFCVQCAILVVFLHDVSLLQRKYVIERLAVTEWLAKLTRLLYCRY